MASRRLEDKIIARLEKESGTIYKPHGGKFTFALAFPSTYYVGMSNLGFQIVYRLLNERDDAVCERVFLPDRDDMDEAARSSRGLVTMESRTDVRGFDVFAFSLSYELDYPNVLKMLSLSHLPLTCEERRSASRMPLVIAGGPAATFNPEPLSPFVDVFVIGEAEAVLPHIMEVMSAGQHKDRDALLLDLAKLPGVYVPRFYQPEYNEDGTISAVNVTADVPARIRRQYAPQLDVLPSTSAILTPETEFSNMILAEVARGCGRQCRFCVAGYAFLPPRSRSHDAVLRDIMGTKAKGEETPRVGLLSASVFDHPSSKLICDALLESERLFSISSTRADTLEKDVVAALRGGGHETLTIAPEAGTDRLRKVINKCILDEDVFRAAETAWDGGFRRLKLYFMIGLPTETVDDIEGIISIVDRVVGLRNWGKVSVSVSCFVPKPWTPFQWTGMKDEKYLSDTLALIKRRFRGVRHLEIMSESSREAVAQGVLARGDRRLKDALILMSQGQNWRGAFREGGVDPSFYAQRQRLVDEVLPWDHLDLGVRKKYLWQEYERAINSTATTPCKPGICRRCGVCI